MDFMIPADVRLDLADGTLCLPDEIRIHLSIRHPAHNTKVQNMTAIGQNIVVLAKELRETNAGIKKAKLWVARGSTWRPTVIEGSESKLYPQMNTLSGEEIILPTHIVFGMWMERDMIHQPQVTRQWDDIDTKNGKLWCAKLPQIGSIKCLRKKLCLW